MPDPLDALRRPLGATPPDERFRAELMSRLETALDHEPNHAAGPTPELDPMEIAMSEPARPGRTRAVVLSTLGVAAAVAAVIGLVLVTRDDADTTSPNDTSPSAPVVTTTAASETTASAPTTVAPPPTDGQIAEAGLLTFEEVGDGSRPSPDGVFTLDRATGPGSTAAACAPFLDTVFESPARPATVRVAGFSKPGAGLQQYIVVFPDEAAAVAMMDAVSDPAFPACMSAIATEAYTASDPDQVTSRTPLLPMEPRPLAPVGDEMTVLALHGTFTYGGSSWDDEGLIPFVRVGRAVTWMNPNSATTVVNSPGYPDAQLEKALAAAAAKLEAAQAP